jgi:S1-C subfamily serine protease
MNVKTWFYLLCGCATTSAPAYAAEPRGDWEATIAAVSPAVVALRVTTTRDFAGSTAGTSFGTGFVVDRERGILLTNRHLVEEGPVVASGVLLNDEEIQLRALYRDPIHDFGFYAFDPDSVRFLDLPELTLAPEAARVGLEVRVLGNDAGEKLAILDGTLARLDREAPDYGRGYNDFNTFYLQAASNTSGGSSGSPVVDREGRVVALNAGARQTAASSYYLPLTKVVEALERIRAGEPVARGTTLSVFRHVAFEEALRLGLSAETEALARGEGRAGVLTVGQVVPGGPADGQLEPGDVLVSVHPVGAAGATRQFADFVDLEAALDAAVGRSVVMVVERQGVRVTLEVPVADAHALTPHALIESGRGVFHEVGLQLAHAWGVPAAGVMVAGGGYAWGRGGVPSRAVIVDIDGRPIDSLDALWEVLAAAPPGAAMRVRWFGLGDPESERVSVVYNDRAWFPLRRCERASFGGFGAADPWSCVDAPPAPPAPPDPAAQWFHPLDGFDRRSSAVAASLVQVEADVPYPTAGLKDFHYSGAGVVVDADRGLVLVDRDTVPVTLLDVMLTFGGEVRVPGRVVAVHPVHGFAIVHYDPMLLGPDLVRSARLVDRPPREGQRVWQVVMDRAQTVIGTEARVDEWAPVTTGVGTTPRFRDRNVELVTLDDALGSIGGAVVDRRGGVLALWASFVDPAGDERFFGGLPVRYVSPTVDALIAGRSHVVHDLGVDLTALSLPDARERGLGAADAAALRAASPTRKVRVAYVTRRTGGAPSRDLLRDGDLIVELDGQPLGRMLDLAAIEQQESAHLVVVRDGARVPIEVPTLRMATDGVDRVLSWAGLVLHAPHPEVAHLTGVPGDGVYIAWVWYGGPGAAYGHRPTRRIVALNGAPTPNLDAMLAAVRSLDPEEPVRLTTIGLDGTRRLESLVLDPASWPTELLTRRDGIWSRAPVETQ